MDSDFRIVSMSSKSDWVISLWGRSFIWHTCYTLKEGLVHLSNLRSEWGCAGECVCVCACFKVSLCTELCCIHVRNIRNRMSKRTEPLPWALEECRWCRMERRERGVVSSMCPFVPPSRWLKMKIEGKGEVWKTLSQGSIFFSMRFAEPTSPGTILRPGLAPGVKAKLINLRYLYLPHTPIPASTSIPPSLSLAHSSSPASLNKGMLSLSALGSMEETFYLQIRRGLS